MSPQQVDSMAILLRKILEKQDTMGCAIDEIKLTMAEQRGEKRGEKRVEKRVMLLIAAGVSAVMPFLVQFVKHVLGVNA